MEGSNRTAIGTSLRYPLYHGVDPNAAGNGEQYSSYGYQYDFTPVQEVGKHELECYAIAYAAGFDPNPIVTAAVSAPFTGPCAACVALLPWWRVSRADLQGRAAMYDVWGMSRC